MKDENPFPLAALRSVLFHHVHDHESPFVRGLGVTCRVDEFRSQLQTLTSWYRPVSIDDVIAAAHEGGRLPRRALLITFDDAYASVAERAAEILEDLNAPSVFFVNGGFVDHALLALDNLVAYASNTMAAHRFATAVRDAVDVDVPDTSLWTVLSAVVPALEPTQIASLRSGLVDALGADPLDLAREEHLYLTADQLVDLPARMQIGGHTWSHARGRTLDAVEAEQQVGANRSWLRQRTGQAVRAFSVPYGSRTDLTPQMSEAVRAAGYSLTFLAEGRLNHGALDPHQLDRVSPSGRSRTARAVELEILPRLRSARDLVGGRSG